MVNKLTNREHSVADSCDVNEADYVPTSEASTHAKPRSWDLCSCCGKWATDCLCHVVQHECKKVVR